MVEGEFFQNIGSFFFRTLAVNSVLDFFKDDLIGISSSIKIARELHYLAEGSWHRFHPVHHDSGNRREGEKTHAPPQGLGELRELVGLVRGGYVGIEGEA